MRRAHARIFTMLRLRSSLLPPSWRHSKQGTTRAIGAVHIRKYDQLSDTRGAWYSFTLPDQVCGSSVNATIQVREEGGTAHVLVRMLQYHCAKSDDSVVQEKFERPIVSKVAPES
ncbi:MAG TPA: hypothetical protein VGQ76_21055 [Thermoanaerobaculia bacterium]|jgi:hypothetical protein|nr:hypothetical protein [Thermoanaerobaculia bacterium]